MGDLSQTNRLFSFDSPLGPNKLLVNSFGGTEQLSELYTFELELISEDFSLDWDQIIDRNVTVGIRFREGTSFRYFNGYINKFEPVRHQGLSVRHPVRPEPADSQWCRFLDWIW